MKKNKYNWAALVADLIKVILAFLAGNGVASVLGIFINFKIM